MPAGFLPTIHSFDTNFCTARANDREANFVTIALRRLNNLVYRTGVENVVQCNRRKTIPHVGMKLIHDSPPTIFANPRIFDISM